MHFLKTTSPNKCIIVKSTTSIKNEIPQKINQSQVINTVIKTIYTNKPAGLIHARTLSDILQRPIRIWQEDRISRVFGKTDDKLIIDAEYQENRKGYGHWTLRGGKDVTSTTKNDCLYEVVASQTGVKSSTLKRKTTMALRRLVNKQLSGFVKLACTEESMLGGARYSGRGSPDAQRILDASQNGQSHPDGSSGHPRGHASHPSTGRSNDTVEDYSYSRWRSGFLSRADQDLVCHYTLITSSAQDLMAELNNGGYKVDRHIDSNQLDYDPLPQAQKWSNGNKLDSPGRFRTVCLVGKHFLNHQNDPRADIFILTFYPIL